MREKEYTPFKCLNYLFNKCDKAYAKRKIEEQNHYDTIKIGLSESM